jgi:hypothetical protein
LENSNIFPQKIIINPQNYKDDETPRKTKLKINSLLVAKFIQVMLICGIIWFVAWAHIYEVLVWNKPFLQTFYTSYHNVLSYILLSIITIYIEYTIHKHKKLGKLDQRKLAKPLSTTTPEKLLETIQQLQSEKEALKRTVWKYKRKPSGLAGYILTIVGALALISSVITSSPILAFIGLGLAFWGILLLYIKPTKYIKNELLDTTTISSLTNIDKLITDLKYNGKPIYISPRTLKELKASVVFISATSETTLPPTEEISKEKIFLKNPNGLRLTPPGLALASLIEKEMGTDLSTADIDYLQNNLAKVLIEDLEIAEDFEMEINDDAIHIKIKRPIYRDLCNQVRKLQNICPNIGCPLCSSIACMLTRATGKPVIIEKAESSQEGTIIDIFYRVIEDK